MRNSELLSKPKTSNTPHILMVTPRYFPYMGGIETHVHEVGRRLTESGVKITLLTTMPYGLATPLPREEMVESMRVIRVPAGPPQRDYYIAPEIYSIIKQGSWDLVHCQGCHTFVPPLAMLAARKAKIPYLVTFHTGGHSSFFRNRIRNAQWQALHSLFAGATKLIGVSRFEADYFSNTLHLPKDRFAVIPNGAKMPELVDAPAASPDQPLIVSVGRLERYKGHHRLIAALPRVREYYPNARLLIVGAGPYENELRLQAQSLGIAENVEIRAIPAHDRQQMAATLAQASVVTLLSKYEAHPIAVMEALALRRPVLVADTSGLSELAEQGLVRAIPLHSTPDQVAAAVRRQIEDPLMPTQFSLPTWDECARKLQGIYDLCMRGELCAS